MPSPRAMLFLLLLAACNRASGAALSDSTYVRTMAELRRIEQDTRLDSAGRASERAAVLRRRNVTPRQLEATAAMLASHPERAAAVWQEIDRRANAPDSATARH